MSVQAIGVESRWGPPDLDQVTKDPPQLVGILDDRDHLHLGAARWAHERINLVDFREKSGPGAFACVDVDLFFAFRQRFVAKILFISGMLMRGLPPLRCPLRNPWQILPPPFRAGGIQPVAANQLQSLRRDTKSSARSSRPNSSLITRRLKSCVID